MKRRVRLEAVRVDYPDIGSLPNSPDEMLGVDTAVLIGGESEEERLWAAIKTGRLAMDQYAQIIRESVLADEGAWSDMLDKARLAGAGELVADYLAILDIVDHVHNGFVAAMRVSMASLIQLHQIESDAKQRALTSSEKKARAARAKKATRAMMSIREEFFKWELGAPEYRGMRSEQFIAKMLSQHDDIKSGGSIRNKRKQWREELAARVVPKSPREG